MKTVIATIDKSIISLINSSNINTDFEVNIFSSSKNPLDLLDFIWQKNPALLLIDDDFLQPNTAKFIEILRNVNHNITIIFLTSDSSIELGKRVAQLGIHYYAIKPIEKTEFVDILNSAINTKNQSITK